MSLRADLIRALELALLRGIFDHQRRAAHFDTFYTLDAILRNNRPMRFSTATERERTNKLINLVRSIAGAHDRLARWQAETERDPFDVAKGIATARHKIAELVCELEGLT